MISCLKICDLYSQAYQQGETKTKLFQNKFTKTFHIERYTCLFEWKTTVAQYLRKVIDENRFVFSVPIDYKHN